MSVSFGGLLESTATFKTAASITAGKLVKMSANGTVAACSDGDKFCGYVVSGDGSYAAVQVRGIVTVPYTGTAPSVGFASLVSDGTGVKTSNSGREHLVISVDSTGSKVTFLI